MGRCKNPQDKPVKCDITMSNVKTNWKRSESKLSLKEWFKTVGQEWFLSFCSKVEEKKNDVLIMSDKVIKLSLSAN